MLSFFSRPVGSVRSLWLVLALLVDGLLLRCLRVTKTVEALTETVELENGFEKKRERKKISRERERERERAEE